MSIEGLINTSHKALVTVVYCEDDTKTNDKNWEVPKNSHRKDVALSEPLTQMFGEL